MKMMECIKDEALARPEGETRSGVTQKIQAGPNNGNKGRNKHKWGQGKSRPQKDKEMLANKELTQKINRDPPISGLNVDEDINL
jgi:hypothetical protein